MLGEVTFKMEFESKGSGTQRTKWQVCWQVEPHMGLEVRAEGPEARRVGNQGRVAPAQVGAEMESCPVCTWLRGLCSTPSAVES